MLWHHSCSVCRLQHPAATSGRSHKQFLVMSYDIAIHEPVVHAVAATAGPGGVSFGATVSGEQYDVGTVLVVPWKEVSISKIQSML
jgi:hypothetical protein